MSNKGVFTTRKNRRVSVKREVTNKLMLLRLIALTEKVNERKLHQLVFILQEEGRREKKKTFNYEFIKWNIEPLCEELQKDLDSLLFERLIKSEQSITISNRGKALIEHSIEKLDFKGLDVFFKFYIYMYLHKPLFELTDFIYKKYEIGRYEDKQVISCVNKVGDVVQKIALEKSKQKIDSTYEDIEKNEVYFVERIKAFMDENKIKKES